MVAFRQSSRDCQVWVSHTFYLCPFVAQSSANLSNIPNHFVEILSLDHNNLSGVISVDDDDCYDLEISADCDEVECECCGLCCYDGRGCF